MSRTRMHKATDEGRECSLCDKFKPWSEFYAGAGTRGKDTRCKDCLRAKQRNYNAKPEVQAAEVARWPQRWESAHPGESYERTHIWKVDEYGRECAYSGEGNCGHSYKPWEEFRVKPRPDGGVGRDTRCKDCAAARTFFSRFLITHAERLLLAESAVFGRGLCDLHGGPETMSYKGGEVRGLSIDHAHDCGRHEPKLGCPYCVRGLLCCDCNRNVIRRAEQFPVLAARFADYLARRPLLAV